MNYLQNRFNLNEDEYKIIPETWCATQFYTITFEGWKGFSFDANDETLSKIIELSSKTIHCFIDTYKDTHAFTQPIFGFKSDGTFYVKIATMENDEFERSRDRQEAVERAEALCKVLNAKYPFIDG